MTVRDIRNVIIKADPDAQHYWSSMKSNRYTVWREYDMLPLLADDVHHEAWKFQIDRYTDIEFDPVAEAIKAMLDSLPDVSYHYQVDFEGTPNEAGVIHHIFECEG